MLRTSYINLLASGTRQSLFSLCELPGCKCSLEKISDVYKKYHQSDFREQSRKFARGQCKVVRTLNENGILQKVDQCVLHKFLQVKIHSRSSEGSPGEINMYPFLEESKKLSLSGESGKFTGTNEYWEQLNPYFSENQDKNFEIFSIGGGGGYDTEEIANILKDKKLNVTQVKSIDSNPLIAHLDPENKKLVNMDGNEFIRNLGPRKENERRIFHLGNFISVLNIEDIKEFISILSSKMEEGDVISIMNIDSNQFKKLSSYEAKNTKDGLQEFFYREKFFRTVISNNEELIKYLKTFNFDCNTTIYPPEKLDRGPNGYKMHFIRILGKKGKTL